jgi:hypothetical protein
MGVGAVVTSANWVALVLVSREPGCKLCCINIGCSCYPVGVKRFWSGKFCVVCWDWKNFCRLLELIGLKNFDSLTGLGAVSSEWTNGQVFWAFWRLIDFFVKRLRLKFLSIWTGCSWSFVSVIANVMPPRENWKGMTDHRGNDRTKLDVIRLFRQIVIGYWLTEIPIHWLMCLSLLIAGWGEKQSEVNKVIA